MDSLRRTRSSEALERLRSFCEGAVHGGSLGKLCEVQKKSSGDGKVRLSCRLPEGQLGDRSVHSLRLAHKVGVIDSLKLGEDRTTFTVDAPEGPDPVNIALPHYRVITPDWVRGNVARATAKTAGQAAGYVAVAADLVASPWSALGKLVFNPMNWSKIHKGYGYVRRKLRQAASAVDGAAAGQE